MSYCVNCGVELEQSEKVCPLCGLEVVNPRQPYDENAIRPYPRRLDPINARINRRFTATILSICIAFPAVLCLTINLIMDNRVSWSTYVAGSMAVLWVMIVPYFFTEKPTLTRLFIPDAAALLLFLLLIDLLRTGASWYLGLGMPLVLLVCGLIYLVGILIEKKVIRGFVIPAAILIAAGLLVVGIEMIVDFYVLGEFRLGWSFFVLIPCLAVAFACLAVARRQSIREEIKKRLHL